MRYLKTHFNVAVGTPKWASNELTYILRSTKEIVVPAQTALPGETSKKPENSGFGRYISSSNIVICKGYTLLSNFAKLISEEPNKIQSSATPGFEDNDPNCAVG